MLLIQLNLQAAAGVSVSSATTDGADVSAASAGVLVATSSATTDGADLTAAQASAIVAASSTTTDGADITAAAIGAVIGASTATTDGQDTTAASASPSVAASSATTDGADITAASVSVVSASVDASSATTDGADVTAGSIGVVVAASSASTDGADVSAGSVRVAIAASSATTDGSDVTAAAVSLVAIEVVAPVVTGGGGVVSQEGSGVYPGFAAERAEIVAKQTPEPIQIPEKVPETAPIAPANATPTDGQSLRRMVNASLRERQLQALGELRLSLQAQQAEQQEIIRLQINDDDEALIALLLSI